MAVRISQYMAQKIVDTVKDICGFDINFFNKEAIVIASTNTERIGNYHGIAAEVIRSGKEKEIGSDIDYMGTRKGVNMPIFFHEELCGVIGISGEPEEVRKYAYLAQRIARMLLKEQEIESSNYSRQLEKNYFVHSLLAEQNPNPEHALEYMKKNAIDGTREFRAVLVRKNKLNSVAAEKLLESRGLSENEIYQVFDGFSGGLYASEYPGSYVLICPAAEYAGKKRILEQLLAKHGNEIEIGVGMPRYLSRVRSSYDGALTALRSDRSRRGDRPQERPACYDDLDLEILLENIPAKVLENYREKIIAALDEDDKRVLRAYFGNDCSLAKTAESLYIHKNTLQYRLNRITELCGYNPRVYRDSVVLYFAIAGTD